MRIVEDLRARSANFKTLTRISSNLYRFEDTCHVYVILHGESAVLVDFGSGDVLDTLEGLGVRRVTDILMTHHHRDQGQGLQRAVEAGIRIWVPHSEQDLFQNADALWQGRAVFNNYNVRQDRFSLLEPVPVSATLKDYAVLRTGGYLFTVIPTPGHTPGSVSLLADIDGMRAAFSGDLIYGPGKVWSMAATQWTYNGAEGVAASIASLVDLNNRKPDLLLPSHGEVMKQPGAEIDLLVDRFQELLRGRGQYAWLDQALACPYERITKHLLRNTTSVANSYVLLSESGKALLIDYGYDFCTGLAAGQDRASRRPWLYSLAALKEQFDVRKIDVAIPTHYHDDHVAGMSLLHEVEGTQIWVPEHFAGVLSRPERYDLPCLWYDPIPVNRLLPTGMPFAWEEYKLTIYPLPGHTRYAAAVAFDVDGQRVLAVGDQYQGPENRQWNYVYQNRFEAEDYYQSVQIYRQVKPDLILPGHAEPLRVTPKYLDEIESGAAELERLHRELMPEEIAGLGPEGTGVRLNPYQVEVRGGEIVVFEVEVRNPSVWSETAILRIAIPEGWGVSPHEIEVDLEAGEVKVVRFHVQTPAGRPQRRVRLAVDLTVGERRFGQQAEGLVTLTA